MSNLHYCAGINFTIRPSPPERIPQFHPTAVSLKRERQLCHLESPGGSHRGRTWLDPRSCPLASLATLVADGALDSGAHLPWARAHTLCSAKGNATFSWRSRSCAGKAEGRRPARGGSIGTAQAPAIPCTSRRAEEDGREMEIRC